MATKVWTSIKSEAEISLRRQMTIERFNFFDPKNLATFWKEVLTFKYRVKTMENDKKITRIKMIDP